MGERCITVQGRGRVSAPPDQAVISLALIAQAKSYGACSRALNRRMEQLGQDLAPLGVNRSDLKTTHLNIWANYVRKGDEDHFQGYIARQDIKLRIGLAEERLNQVLDAATASESAPQVSLSFDIADRHHVEQRALEDAVADARRNAETITRTAGLCLGEIASIQYGYATVHVRQEHSLMLRESSAGYSAEPEEMEATDSVTIVWEILPE